MINLLNSDVLVLHRRTSFLLRINGIVRIPFVYHFLFWAIYFCFNWIRWGSFYEDYVFSFKSNAVEFPLHIALVYFNILYLMPKLLPKKVVWYIVIFLLSTLVIVLIKIAFTYFFVTTDIYIESNKRDNPTLLIINYIIAAFIGEIYVVGSATAIQMTVDYISSNNRAAELKRVNMETELAFLKSQIQPHFFFNTLNNLYSLTLDKSDKAPETVLKLSELMSYVIYDAKNKRVPLMDEIKHIQNYLDLEKLRYGKRLKIKFDISGVLEGKQLPPLLLLPFIENSFKHGTRISDKSIPILIELDVTSDILTFKTENKQSDDFMPDNNLEKDKHGVGMQNTLRRLNLVYEDRYNMDIKNTDGNYCVILKIPIE